jgi:hypothetical protein
MESVYDTDAFSSIDMYGQAVAEGGTAYQRVTVENQCEDAAEELTPVSASSDWEVMEADGTYTVPEVLCEDGSVMVESVGTLEVQDAGSTELWNWTAPDWVTTLPQDSPDCTLWDVDCRLLLKKLLPGGQELDCLKNAPACEDWLSDPLKEDHYVCRFGPDIVSLDFCNVYPRPGDDPVPSADPYGNPEPSSR